MRVLDEAPPAPSPPIVSIEWDDARLARGIRDGDQEALRRAYDEHASAVMGVAIAVLKDRDHAQDVVQEVYVRLWDRPERFDPERGSLKSFLQMDAHGRAIDLIRSIRSSEARDRADHVRTASTPAPGTEELAMDNVVSSNVQAALAKLPEDQRTPIALAFLGGYSYRDVAAQLGLPEGTVKSRIRAGMRRLQLVLAAEAI
jgi:RNA polymerase sigma-70 factor, ECF subfamily